MCLRIRGQQPTGRANNFKKKRPILTDHQFFSFVDDRPDTPLSPVETELSAPDAASHFDLHLFDFLLTSCFTPTAIVVAVITRYILINNLLGLSFCEILVAQDHEFLTKEPYPNQE